jgi:apolipoprotein N-acyltransferase
MLNKLLAEFLAYSIFGVVLLIGGLGWVFISSKWSRDRKFGVLWGLLAGGLTAIFWVLSIPPFEFGEAAYIAFVPLLLWLYARPGRLMFWSVAIGTGWIAWFVILIWLRHVTLFGTIALSGFLGCLFAGWLYLVRRTLPVVADRSFAVRVLAFSGLAGAWVVFEWVRTWLFWGFPWAPISLSQWGRPVVLQIAAWTGAYGVSFLLILFNLCIAQTLRNRVVVKERKLWTGWFSPDLYLAMGALGVCVVVFFKSLPARNSVETLFTAGVVQPYIAPELKWDETKELENFDILERQTRFVASLESDILLWPEAATPWPIVGYPQIQWRVEQLVDEIGKPILMGNLAWKRESDLWYNGVFLVEPNTGLAKDYYVKRELVPFGEYVPFEFIEKVVPIGGNFTPGAEAGLIELTLNGRRLKVGPLVCYEDAFPRLARESARAGAQIFFVATNNAWYGEEGGASQHAAHSVLRAVENRRPVMRCGNGGWSGWIDSYGTVREVIYDENGSIYFRGGGCYTVFQFAEWMRQQSFYTRHGDWFVWLSAGLMILALAVGALLQRKL